MKTTSRHALLCASAALLLLTSAPAQADNNIAGVTAAVNPDARSFDAGGKPKLISLGDPVIRNHRIETSGQGLVQILLADGTSFTVGPNSSVVIDSFVYDPEKNTASLAATMTKGALRFIGGKASKASGDVKIDTPIGTAGIRGAVVDINLNGQTPDGQPLPPHMTLVYGKEVQLTGNGAPQRLFKQGFSIVAGDGQPRIQRTPPQWVSGLQQFLAGRPGQSGGASNTPTDQTVASSAVSQTNSAQLPSENAIPVPQPRPIVTTPVEEVAGESQRDVGTRPEVPDDGGEPWDGSVGVVSEDEGYRELSGSFGQMTRQADGSWAGTHDEEQSFTLEGKSASSGLTSATVSGSSTLLGQLEGTAYAGSGEFIAYLMRNDVNDAFIVVGGQTASMSSTFTGTKVLHYVVQPDPATGAVSIGAVNSDLARALAGSGAVNSDLLVVAASGVNSSESAAVGKAIQASILINGTGTGQFSAINVTAGTFARLEQGGHGLTALSSGGYLTSPSGDVENTQSVVETVGGSESSDELFGKNGEYMVIVASGETYVPDPGEGEGTIYYDVGANVLSRNNNLTQTNVSRSFANQTLTGFAAGAVKTWSGIDLDTGTVSLSFNGSTNSFTGAIDIDTADEREEIYLTSSNSETAYLNDRLIAAASDVDGSYLVSSDVVPAKIFADDTSSAICNSCSFMTWGWWGKAASGESSQSVHLGNWIIGKTPEVGRLPSSGSATYNGNAVGTVLNNGDQYIATGTMRSTMNFGTRTGDVEITDYDGRDFTSNVNFGSGAATFSGSGTTDGVSSTVTGAFASNGTDPVKGIMGNFRAVDGTWSSSGIFAGSR
ncbi:FecR domain-containing protein [Rhizobium rosettiformans]|uniref:FecR domain-containing protein n=1 Tax=Rhizobium rosettiformans TaxID=1368430 RepID=UPI00286A63E4|nr:FecR domain-containing protein [Rhizobium rosettiformans]